MMKALKKIAVVLDIAALFGSAVVIYHVIIYYLGKGPYSNTNGLWVICSLGLILCGSFIRKRADQIENKNHNEDDNKQNTD